MRVFVLAGRGRSPSRSRLSHRLAAAQDENMKMAAKLLEEAATAFQGGKTKEVIDLATKAAKLDPKNPAAPFVIGSAHLALRQNEEAVEGVHRRSSNSTRSSPLAYDRRGDAYLKMRQVQGGHRRLRQVPGAAPEVRPGPLAARHRALLRRPVRRRPQAVRPAPHGEPGGRGELGLALPVQRPREHAEEGPRRPDPGHEGHPRADEAGARTVRRQDQAAGRARRGREREAEGRRR